MLNELLKVLPIAVLTFKSLLIFLTKNNDNTKRISVSLGKGSYSYQYFSNYHVDLKFDNSGLITINVQK